MKRFTNLPANLRALFGFLRGLTIVVGVFALAGLLLEFALLPRYGAAGSIGITMGVVVLQPEPAAVELRAPGVTPGALVLKPVHGWLEARPGSQDAVLRTMLLQSTVPSMLVTIVTAYVLFTALRRLCGNWEAGNMFSDENLRLVRRIGLTLVISSLLNAVLGIWASAVVGGFLRSQVSIGAGVKLFEFAGTSPFSLPAGIVSVPGGLVTGLLVLMLTAAFRQGLSLKAENDLTV